MSAVLQERPVETPTTQTIVLPVGEKLMAGVRPAGAVIEAQAWEITDADMAQLAANQRTEWAKRADQISEMGEEFVKPARDALASVRATFNKWLKPAIDDLNAGREILGAKLLAWDQAEKARLAREQAEREALARRLRQEAEAKAAAERARAEEQAREARRKEQEAQEAQRKALAEGNARAAAAAAAEAAKQAEKAAAAVENGNAKAQEAQLAAAAQVQAAPVAAPVRVAGQSVKDNWIAEMNTGLTEDQAKALIVAEAATRPELLGLLELDTGAINKMAKALKGAMRVPGFTAANRPLLAGSRK